MEQKKILYLFDFDGTITNKDSLFDFLKFINSPFQYYTIFLFYLPCFFLAKIGLLKNDSIKEKFIAAFLKGKSQKIIEQMAQKYTQTIEKIIRPEANKLIQEVVKNNLADCYIVSASLDIWLIPIAEKLNLNLICTKALYSNGIYTGKFGSLNCNNYEKKNRILKEINLEKYQNIIAYGDSKGDKIMFSLAKEIYYKPFR